MNILKELDKIADVALFPIGQPQPTTQQDADLVGKLHNKQSDFDPTAPCVKIWHEHSLAERIGRGKYYGFPIFELNKFDLRRLKNLECCDEVLVCSSWARDVVLDQTKRPENEVHVVPLGVDRTVFNENKNKNNSCTYNTCMYQENSNQNLTKRLCSACVGLITWYIIPHEFMISNNSDHYHVPLLLSPYGYSTYRGS